MSVNHLRVLVVLSFLLLGGSYVAPELFASSDPGIVRLVQFDGSGGIIASNAFFVLPPIVLLAACIGVAFMQNWGRYLYLAWVVYSVGISFAYGYRVSSPLEEFLSATGIVLDGAILAGVFLSPLRSYFGNARP